MKQWGVEIEKDDLVKIEKAIKEDKEKVNQERTMMMVYAKMMNDMLEHLEIEVEYGFITEKERRKIMEGMKLIAEVYKDQKKDEVDARINQKGANRIKKKFADKIRVVEVDAE